MKVVEKRYEFRVPAWLGRSLERLITRLGGTPGRGGVSATLVIGDEAEVRNLVAGEAGTGFPTETKGT